MKKSDLKQIIREELEKMDKKLNRSKNTWINAIQNIIRDNEEAQNYLGKHLLKIKKERLNDLSFQEILNLHSDIIEKFTKPNPSIDPNQNVNPYDILNKGKGHLGATYTGD